MPLRNDPPKSLFTSANFDEAAGVIRSATRYRPWIGLVLGSGLGCLAERVRNADVLCYESIPYFPHPAVEGHAGRLIVGLWGDREVLLLQGRAHYYEGYSLPQVTFPIRVMQRLGVKILIVTNAAGGVNPALKPGDIMLITDQLDLITMAGLSPLRGPHEPELGPRFPSMQEAYDPQLLNLARRLASVKGLSLREGIYCMLAGPHYETPADIRFLRSIGVDAVGMSTVPEVIVARHGGMRVLGLSVISNTTYSERRMDQPAVNHTDVLAVTSSISGCLGDLIEAILNEIEPPGFSETS